MSDIGDLRLDLLWRILEGPGETSLADRQAAFDLSDQAGPRAALSVKVATHAHRVTDEDINAVKASGLSEDQIFEIVVCAAIGEANRQYDAALGALEAALGQ